MASKTKKGIVALLLAFNAVTAVDAARLTYKTPREKNDELLVFRLTDISTKAIRNVLPEGAVGDFIAGAAYLTMGLGGAIAGAPGEILGFIAGGTAAAGRDINHPSP